MAETILDIYKQIINGEPGAISNLESEGYLEKFLFESITESLEQKTLLLILALINFKYKKRINIWEYLKTDINKFNIIFENATNLNLKDLCDQERIIYITFMINCFQSFDEKFIQSLCIKLVSMPIWLRISPISVKSLLLKNCSKEYLIKWKKITELSGEIFNSKPCYYFNQILEDFLSIYESNISKEKSKFPEKFLEWIIDILSSIPTRRFTLAVLKEKHFIERVIILSNQNQVNPKILDIMKFYYFFEIDDETGEALNPIQIIKKHYENINLIQSTAYKLFPEKLSKVYLKNVSLIDEREQLTEMLNLLSSEEAFNFAEKLNLLKYPQEFYSLPLIYEIFCLNFEKRKVQLEQINSLPLYPTEEVIFTDEFNEGQEVLPLMKLNLQYLSNFDYLIRNFTLFRLESAYQIKLDIQNTIENIHPKFNSKGIFEGFEGWARMACPVRNFKILSVKAPEIGKLHPVEVIAEIEVSMSGIQSQIKQEWDKIKRYDVLFLVLFDSNRTKHIRGCEVKCVIDEENNEFSEFEIYNKKKPHGNKRRIQVYLDPIQYQNDLKNKDLNIDQVYSGFQLLVRRKQKENNFKAFLETVRDLMNSTSSIPKFLESIFLGYGDGKKNEAETQINLDFKDTFLDVEHFDKIVKNNENLARRILKPKTLEEDEVKNLLNSYFITNFDQIKYLKAKRNKVRFVESQIEAISNSLTKGLSMIVGPPGTGKTDVAVQIVNLLHHNFPNERTLIIAHSNQALNDIFEKIAKLDIPERYLLRLGMGEKDLDLKEDYSKIGRINFMLTRRMQLLVEVSNLAKSLNIYSHEEYTCETALNFFENHVQPKALEFLKKSDDLSLEIKVIFPFLGFFVNNFYMEEEQQIFVGDREIDLNKAKLLLKYIDNINTELKESYAFELLRNINERGNYLLTKHSKVIALTCTHAALKRKEFLKLNFEYDNIIMEEAAQYLEIETYIPLLLQKDPSKLKRVVLIGDHYQLPPIIKSNIFKHYGKMDQSMFQRFIRLQVPYVSLNFQGRTRSTICELYRWRYNSLQDLSVLNSGKANAGFLHEYQFINVSDSQGETAPLPYFYQNLAEAEYIVATYMYMCLVGYDPQKITILTTYNGQKYLIRDIIRTKCAWNPLFKTPFKITTVDKYQGQQNDIILLSLVRTKSIGHLRDIRRLIVALSRAKYGLYVFGKFELFRKCFEIENSMKIFEKRDLELKIILNEYFPCQRALGELNNEQVITVKDYVHFYTILQEILKIRNSKQ